MKAGSSATSPELRDVLGRFFDLSTREQLEGYQKIQAYLGSEAGVESELDRSIKRKAEALKVLLRVTEELRKRSEVKAGEAPTAKQFDEGAKALGLKWRSGQVIRTYGSWRNARRAVLNERVRESPSQKRARARAVGRTRSYEEPVHALRLWLETEPEGCRVVDYDAFAKETNQRLKQCRKPLPNGTAIRTGLGLPWQPVLSVARQEVTFKEARRKHQAELLRGLSDDALVGASVVDALLGIQTRHVDTALVREDFPKPVARVGNYRAWVLGDLKAYQAGNKPPQREEYEQQAMIVDSSEMAQLLDLSPDYLLTLINQEKWHRIPQPDGSVGQNHYWLRDGLEKRLKKAKQGTPRRDKRQSAGRNGRNLRDNDEPTTQTALQSQK